jgi:hypothetical protein
MICECCKKKMLEGYIPNMGLWWLPKSGENGLWRQDTRTEGFQLASMEMTGVRKEMAYYCPECDRIVIDCKALEDRWIWNEHSPWSGKTRVGVFLLYRKVRPIQQKALRAGCAPRGYEVSC